MPMQTWMETIAAGTTDSVAVANTVTETTIAPVNAKIVLPSNYFDRSGASLRLLADLSGHSDLQGQARSDGCGNVHHRHAEHHGSDQRGVVARVVPHCSNERLCDELHAHRAAHVGGVGERCYQPAHSDRGVPDNGSCCWRHLRRNRRQHPRRDSPVVCCQRCELDPDPHAHGSVAELNPCRRS
jgi:hypothetical protein